mgnify:FL=1
MTYKIGHLDCRLMGEVLVLTTKISRTRNEERQKRPRVCRFSNEHTSDHEVASIDADCSIRKGFLAGIDPDRFLTIEGDLATDYDVVPSCESQAGPITVPPLRVTH